MNKLQQLREEASKALMTADPITCGKKREAYRQAVVDAYEAGLLQQLPNMGKGLSEVLLERHRQLGRFSPEQDLQLYRHQQLELAAASYLLYAGGDTSYREGVQPKYWPWHRDWWKPRNRRRALIKAGALVLAALDRLEAEGGTKRS